MGTAAIFSHSMNAAQSLIGSNVGSPVSQASASEDTSGTSSSSTSSATISANDFLTLLVTEMQNQDPTADTDPNEYINQLVSVNSLEQLIDINQNLSTALGSPSTTSSGGAGIPATANTSASSDAANPTSLASGVADKSGVSPSILSSPLASGANTSVYGALSAVSSAPGNLSVPEASAASQRIAHSLDGVAHKHSITAPLTAGQSSM